MSEDAINNINKKLQELTERYNLLEQSNKYYKEIIETNKKNILNLNSQLKILNIQYKKEIEEMKNSYNEQIEKLNKIIIEIKENRKEKNEILINNENDNNLLDKQTNYEEIQKLIDKKLEDFEINIYQKIKVDDKNEKINKKEEEKKKKEEEKKKKEEEKQKKKEEKQKKKEEEKKKKEEEKKKKEEEKKKKEEEDKKKKEEDKKKKEEDKKREINSDKEEKEGKEDKNIIKEDKEIIEFKGRNLLEAFESKLLKFFSEENNWDDNDKNELKKISTSLIIKGLFIDEKLNEFVENNINKYSAEMEENKKMNFIKKKGEIFEQLPDSIMNINTKDLTKFIPEFRERYGITEKEIKDKELKKEIINNEYNVKKILTNILQKLNYLKKAK